MATASRRLDLLEARLEESTGMTDPTLESLVTEMRELECRVARVVLETLQGVLEGRVSREKAASLFLKLYTEIPLPDPLEDMLATLILIDEPPETGGPTTRELEEIAQQLQQLVRGHS